MTFVAGGALKPDFELHIELTKADMTTLWIRQEFDAKSKLLPGSAQWIALGVHIGEQQSV